MKSRFNAVLAALAVSSVLSIRANAQLDATVTEDGYRAPPPEVIKKALKARRDWLDVLSRGRAEDVIQQNMALVISMTDPVLFESNLDGYAEVLYLKPAGGASVHCGEKEEKRQFASEATGFATLYHYARAQLKTSVGNQMAADAVLTAAGSARDAGLLSSEQVAIDREALDHAVAANGELGQQIAALEIIAPQRYPSSLTVEEISVLIANGDSYKPWGPSADNRKNSVRITLKRGEDYREYCTPK